MPYLQIDVATPAERSGDGGHPRNRPPARI